MTPQNLKIFLLNVLGCFIGCSIAMLFFNSKVDVGRLFLPAPKQPAEISTQAPTMAAMPTYETICENDINLKCAPEKSNPNLGSIVSCLLDQDELSPVCKQSIQVFAMRLAPCDAEAQKFCPGVKMGRGRLLKCLKQNKEKIKNPNCLPLL